MAARGDEQPFPPKVALSIKSQDGDQTYFRFARNKKLQFLLSDYCKGKSLNYKSVVFLYNGNRVKATRTPDEIGMEDGDQIDAMVHQNGGGNLALIRI